jgi:hypothetical protein
MCSISYVFDPTFSCINRSVAPMAHNRENLWCHPTKTSSPVILGALGSARKGGAAILRGRLSGLGRDKWEPLVSRPLRRATIRLDAAENKSPGTNPHGYSSSSSVREWVRLCPQTTIIRGRNRRGAYSRILIKRDPIHPKAMSLIVHW